MRTAIRMLVLLPVCACLAAPLARAQNMVILLMDDVGRADLDQLIEDGRAPNLAHIAQRGFRFSNAIANPLCQQTRRSIDFGDFSVRYSGHVCRDDPEGTEPPLELVSLPELVKVPSMLFGKWHEGPNPAGPWQLAPQAHGWGGWRAGFPGGITACGGVDYWNWTRVDDGVARFARDAYQPAVQFRRWRDWWTSASGPRLALYSAALAHAPFHRPPDEWLPADYPPTPSDRAMYEAMIVALDVTVGRMLPLLSPDDFLIVVGDNGTPGSVAGTPLAKGTTFERGIRVPLIVYGGWIRPGKSDALVHVADLYATVAELLGTRADPGRASRSLVPLLKASTSPLHEYVLAGTVGHPKLGDDVCARSLRYKLRRAGTPPVEAFYDLELDPDEQLNRIDDPACQSLIAAHRAWLESALK